MKATIPFQAARPRSFFFHLGALGLLGVMDSWALIRRRMGRFGWWFVGLASGGILLGMLGVSIYAMHSASARAAAMMNSAVTVMNSGLEMREQEIWFENWADQVRRGEVESMPASEVARFREQLAMIPVTDPKMAGRSELADLRRALNTLRNELLAPLAETGLDRATSKETFKRLEIAGGNLRESIAGLISAEVAGMHTELVRTKAESDRTLQWILTGWGALLGLTIALVIGRLMRDWLKRMGVASEAPFSQ